VGIKNGSSKNFEYLNLNLKDIGVWGLRGFFNSIPLPIPCVLGASLRWKHSTELFIQVLKNVMIILYTCYLN